VSGHWSESGPPTPVLASSFLLAGLGTVVLGPLLPQLLHDWSLSDQRGGLLLLAKFVGAFCGGAAVPRHLRLGVLAGHILAAIGFAAFAFAHGLALALPALFLTGLGLGEIIASTNILAGRLWPAHAGSALALLNFFWSLGAVATGLILAALLPRTGWQQPVLGLAGLYAVVGVLTLLTRREGRPPSASASVASELSIDPLAARLSAVYGSLLFLYGGLETCLTAWLTTFSLRFAGGHLLGGQSGFVVLWAALTAGRVLASALMRRFAEVAVQRASLGLAFVLIVTLAASHSAATLSLSCVLLGLALAPIFPSTFALLLRHQVPPRTAGTLLAVSGLGAALFPWLMGVVSTHFGSLRLAMLVPALLIPVMLVLSRFESQNGTAFPPGGMRKGEDSAKLAV
jgi:MFS transporter, FHS family, glucose/mannose:H+ symporter